MGVTRRPMAVPAADDRRAQRVDQLLEVVGVLVVMAVALIAVCGLFLVGAVTR
jgi:hypothetical protein